MEQHPSGSEGLPPIRELIEEQRDQPPPWRWEVGSPSIPAYQYLVPYVVAYGSPPMPFPASRGSLPPATRRLLPMPSTTQSSVYYYPTIPLEHIYAFEHLYAPQGVLPHTPGSHPLPPQDPTYSPSPSSFESTEYHPVDAASPFYHHSSPPEIMSSPPRPPQQTPETPTPEAHQPSHHSEATTPTPRPALKPSRHRDARRPTVITPFVDVAAHTAKCDECDRRNREGMIRCCACGWQCCRRCLNDRGGDRRHQSFGSIHAPGPSEAERAAQDRAAQALVNMNVGGSAENESCRARTSARETPSESILDSEETLSWPPRSEDPVVEAGDEGLELAGRRNPPRGARPGDLAE